MKTGEKTRRDDDPFHLARFVAAQAEDYTTALAEIRAGQKHSHWMWYIFPQFAGLGMSAMSQRYAIRSMAEARAYLAHPLLGSGLAKAIQKRFNQARQKRGRAILF